MVKFGGKIGTLYQMLKNALKKHPLQNRTNVQIKGGGGQRPFEQCSKKLHFFERKASLIMQGERKGWVSTSDQADRREDKGEEMALLVRRQHQGALRGRGT